MIRIRHRFSNNSIHPETEILILGTFNPDTPGNAANFFYSRSRNHLWKLLPIAFNEPSLKQAERNEKQLFCEKHHIGFTDLIEEIEVEPGQEVNYADEYIDGKVTLWQDVLSVMKGLGRLKKVGFTRKTFAKIPHIRQQLVPVSDYCTTNGIFFSHLTTPARIYSKEKQDEWTRFLTQ